MGRWRDKLARLGEANEAARLKALRSLTHRQTVELLEGILGSMPYPPRPSPHGPGTSPKVSLGRLGKAKR